MNSKDTFWFRHDSNAKDDPKCVLLIDQLGLEGYGIYWVLVEILREQPDYTYPIALLPPLARRYNTTAEKMKAVVCGYGLFELRDDKIFFSESLLRRMEEYNLLREKRKAAGALGGRAKSSGSKSQASVKQLPSNCQADAKQYIYSNNSPLLSNPSLDKSNSGLSNNEELTPTSEKSEAEAAQIFPENSIPVQKKAEVLSNKQCQQVVDFWNRKVTETGAQYPLVKSLSEERKSKIRIRWGEFSKLGNPVEVCRILFEKACASKFLQGDSARGFHANFDWIMTNGKNWLKIYEGNYDETAAGTRTRIDALKNEYDKIDEIFGGKQNYGKKQSGFGIDEQ